MTNRTTRITMTIRIPPEMKTSQSFLSQEAFQKPINKEVSPICFKPENSPNQSNTEVFHLSPNQEAYLSLSQDI